MEGSALWLPVLVIGLLVVAIVVIGVAIAVSAPGEPPPLRSVVDAIDEIGRSLGGLPAASVFRARDGAALTYRTYPAAPERVAVLVHGSSASGTMMHPLAQALQGAGVTTYALDLRGHGGSGEKGDIAYIGQLEDDIADFLASSSMPPRARRVLIGHSSGGGLALRFAGGPYGDRFDGYLLLTPFLAPNAPTARPDGGWASVAIPRIIGLTILDQLHFRALEWLPVVGFALTPEQRRSPQFTARYSFRLQANFGPHPDWRADLRGIRKPAGVLVGSADEIFFADRMGPVIHEVRPDIPVDIVPGANHARLVLEPAALQATVAAFAALADGPR